MAAYQAYPCNGMDLRQRRNRCNQPISPVINCNIPLSLKVKHLSYASRHAFQTHNVVFHVVLSPCSLGILAAFHFISLYDSGRLSRSTLAFFFYSKTYSRASCKGNRLRWPRQGYHTSILHSLSTPAQHSAKRVAAAIRVLMD